MFSSAASAEVGRVGEQLEQADNQAVSGGPRAMQRIDGQDAAGTRYAGADLAVLALLVVAEKDVAMIDLAVDADDVDGADPAFAAPAVGNHLMAGFIEYVEHRAIAGDDELDTGVREANPEGFGRQQAAGAKGLVGKIG